MCTRSQRVHDANLNQVVPRGRYLRNHQISFASSSDLATQLVVLVPLLVLQLWT